MNFFRTYTPLNNNNEATVYLVQTNQKSRELHRLQFDSITLDDKKNKLKGDHNNAFSHHNKTKKLDMNKIVETLPGLVLYQEP